ncbi:MAG: hypothetical protein WBC21_03900 [Minisyncoccales bacterium]
MNQVKILTTRKEIIISLIQFAVLTGIITIAPLFYNQAITGPIVNATLFISVMLLGVQGAILVGLIPSLVALSIGLLPLVLAPMVPFIMLGNTLLILCFSYIKDKNFWLGVLSASILKFLFLFCASSTVMNLIINEEIALKASIMMSWPQLFTALAGGLIAYLFLKSIKQI